MYVHMQCSLVASWSCKGPQEIIGIQIFPLPIQFSQFKNNQPALCPAVSQSIEMPESPYDPSLGVRPVATPLRGVTPSDLF